jgi:hypothetical protein
MGFKKIQIFAQNPKVLAFGFTENASLWQKPDRNVIFVLCDPHIMDLYISFMSFKIFKFLLKIQSC